MEVELTAPRRAVLAEAGYVVEQRIPKIPGRVGARNTDQAAVDITVVPLDDANRALLVAHFHAWVGIVDPGIEVLLDGLDLGDAAAFVSPASTDQTLGAFVAEHGRLDAAQASTVLSTLGRTLARLHADGLHYGEMTADRILLRAGQPVLGTALPGALTLLPPSPAEDAYHLAVLLRSVLAPSTGRDALPGRSPALREIDRLVTSALGDTASRPGVGTLAARSHELAPGLPLLIGVGQGATPGISGARSSDSPLDAAIGWSVLPSSLIASAPAAHPGEDPLSRARVLAAAQPRGIRRMRGRRAVLATVGLAIFALVGGYLGLSQRTGAVAHGGAPEGKSQVIGDVPSGGSAAELVDAEGHGPAAAAELLTTRRLELVAELTNAGVHAGPGQVPDPAEAFTEVAVAGSPAHTQAVALVKSLVAQGGVIDGLAAVVTGASLVDATTPGSATAVAEVSVTFAVTEYTITGPGPAQVIMAAMEPCTIVLVLALESAGWRVSEVRESPDAAPTQQPR